MIKKIFLVVLIILAVGMPIRLYILGRNSMDLTPVKGIRSGVLRPCPSKPNCVSSFADVSHEDHYLAPILINDYPLIAIKDFAKGMSMELVEEKENYLHFTIKSSIFSFVDDVEFLYQASEKKLHFRSASRVGHSDMSANKKRMKSLKKFITPKEAL
jgi:uncharacterized protein (DUF1499 family)